jgi:sulfite reductase (NADPH) flavoprotein alpha-component
VPAVEAVVLYGTEYGFAKEIAAKLVGTLRSEFSIRATALDMAECPTGGPLALVGTGDASAPQAVLLVCSTHGDGVPPPEARDFCDWLGGKGAPSLEGYPFAVCALGDTGYTHFCKAGRALDSRLEALGGSRLARREDVNREDWPAVDAWIAAAAGALAAAALPPRAPRAAPAGADAAAAPAKALPHGKARPFRAALVDKEGLCVLDGTARCACLPIAPLVPIECALTRARICRALLTGPDDKDTVRLEFDIAGSGLEYAPGDALGVFPVNAPAEVERLLAALGATGAERVPPPAWRLPGGDAPLMALRDALAECYDLRDPRPAMLTWMAEVRCAALRAQHARADDACNQS